MQSTNQPVKGRYLSLSTTTVVFGVWTLGLLLSSAGKIPPSKQVLFFSMSTTLGLVTGAHLGGLRARGDRISRLREVVAIVVATGGALLAAWITAEMSR